MNGNPRKLAAIAKDLSAGTAVFLVALPLCLGIALASDAPPIAGIFTGIVGGILVGLFSGSHTSVSGPTAGLTAVVALQIKELGSFEGFLLALAFAGILQIVLGLLRSGILGYFFPSTVIKGLLAAIGIILILKQLPHVLGHDFDPEGEMSFFQPDKENTFSEIVAMVFHHHSGAAMIGLASVFLLIVWDKWSLLKNSAIPVPLVVVVLGIAAKVIMDWFGGSLAVSGSHLVKVPVVEGPGEFTKLFMLPDFSLWKNPAIYSAGLILALVASLETLLNLKAVDKLDSQQRTSPPDRELLVQGAGNFLLGLIGGIPMTSVIVRSSVNINAGAQTRISTIFHGALLLVSVVFFSGFLNQIPLSCLAAILLVTGIKLASPSLVKQMWNEGRYQFIPFSITVGAIIFTDLLTGILIGLVASTTFILSSNLRWPLNRVMEKHLGGEVLHIQLATQVSFFNRPALDRTLREVPRDGHVLIDASNTDYIDPDILDLIREFKEVIAPAHGAQVSLRGFREKYQLQDEIQFVDYSTRELQEKLTAAQVLQILQEGNARFRAGKKLTRDFGRQLDAGTRGQHPLAVILSCIDSRSPAELIFDLGLGDIFSVRIAGNVVSNNILASMEYSCAVAGAKLILVVGHSKCGAVTAAADLACSGLNPEIATGCQHMGHIVTQIQTVIDEPTREQLASSLGDDKSALVDEIARRNVLRIGMQIVIQSKTIQRLIREGQISLATAFYNITTGEMEILSGPMELADLEPLLESQTHSLEKPMADAGDSMHL
ncbi:MAG: sulfate transporter [Gemmataceae bacterium]|nr:sulfate transporter [Gemmataceae bacterium]